MNSKKKSVRSYLDRVIGESLNQALYDLEVQRERRPDKTELFTANGSIKFISQYLLDHKQRRENLQCKKNSH